MHRYKPNLTGPALSVPDQKAVDVLLDFGATLPQSRHARHAEVVAPLNRIAAASKVLKLLGELPAGDPPADLVARTLSRIDRPGPARVDSQAATPLIGHSPLH